MKIFPLGLVAILLLVGCNSAAPTEAGATATATNLFLTIEWYGPQSKPVKEVGFASSDCAAKLKDWIAIEADTGARKGAILSPGECSRLDAVLQKGQFKERQRIVQPLLGEGGFEEFQYVVSFHSSRGDVYIPLGNNSTKQSMLKQISESLNTTNRVFLEPIAQFGSPQPERKSTSQEL